MKLQTALDIQPLNRHFSIQLLPIQKSYIIVLFTFYVHSHTSNSVVQNVYFIYI